MSYVERLNMLFDGEDASLLGIDVGLRETRIDTQDQSGQDQGEAADLPLLDVIEVEVANPGDKQAEASPDNATGIQPAEPEMETEASKEDIPVTDGKPRPGETAYFCSIDVLSTAHKYIGGKFLRPAVDRFYNKGKFWERTWDLYYVRVPKHILCVPLLFTPISQAQALIDEINAEFGSDISLPLEEEAGLVVPFTPDGTPQPEYMGTSTNNDIRGQLQNRANAWCHENPIEWPEEGNEPYARFRRRIKIVCDVKYNKHRATVGDDKYVKKVRRWHRQLKRTQCYLGLRPRIARRASRETQIADDATSTPATPAVEQQQQQQQQGQTNGTATVPIGTVLDPLDVESPAPFAFADEPIFICIDLESNERNHSQVTEVGVSTLDTLDLVGVPPGEGGRNWTSKIRSRHFRVSEYKHFRNKKFVHGCPDDFVFGSSEFVRRAYLAQVVDACCKPPYSGHIAFSQQPVSTIVKPHHPSAVYLHLPQKESSQERKRQSHPRPSRGRRGKQSQSPEGGVRLPSEPSNSPKKSSNSPRNRGRSRRRKQWSPTPGTEPSSSRSPGQQDQRPPARTPSPTIPEYKMRPRKLILIGHGLTGDIKNLCNVGCEFFDIETYSGEEFSTLSKFHDVADTANVHRILKREYGTPGLSYILKDLDIMPWHLHNAGNDARYTLEALVGIAVQITKAEARAESERDAIRLREYPDVDNPNVMVSPRSSDEDLHWRREMERIAKKPRCKRRKEDSEIETECDIWEEGMGWNAFRNRHKDDMDGGLPPDVHYPVV